VHYTENNKDSFKFTFKGTGIEVITEKDSSQGDIDIYVDNQLKQTISTYNASRQVHQTVYNIVGLSQGVHTLKVVKKSFTRPHGTALSFSITSSITVNRTDPGIEYKGDSFQYKFKGTGIEWITEKGPAQGEFDIYLWRCCS
jgi:alpha-galactosidase